MPARYGAARVEQIEHRAARRRSSSTSGDNASSSPTGVLEASEGNCDAFDGASFPLFFCCGKPFLGDVGHARHDVLAIRAVWLIFLEPSVLLLESVDIGGNSKD